MSEYQKYQELGQSRDFVYFSTFPGYPGGFALSAAELAISLLKFPIPSQNRLVWLSVLQELTMLRSFATFAASRGCYSFSTVTLRLQQEYVNVLVYGDSDTEPKSPSRTRDLIGFLYRIWDYSNKLSEPLPEKPFRSEKEEYLGRLPAEEQTSWNKTPPIPDNIYGPFMQACMDYVQQYSKTIIPAWKCLQREWDTNIKDASIQPNGKEKRLTKAAKRIFQNSPAYWLKTPWRKRGDLYLELFRLRTACIAVILAYSGIRCSELFAIEEKCCVNDFDDDGEKIYYLNTILHKHRTRGAKDTWVIIEEVVEAIAILDQITEHARRAMLSKRLLLTAVGDSFFEVQTINNRNKYGDLSSTSLLENFETLRDHIGKKTIHAPVPLWKNEDGKMVQWKFNTRQFRRTLARHIIRQPFGVIAGMLQYKHLHVSMMEGYGGMDLDWADLLEDEKALSQFNVVDNLAIALKNRSISGPAGTSLIKQFDKAFKGRAQAVTAAEIAKWLSNPNKTIHIGKFALCFFDAKKAVCLQNSEYKEMPIINSCDPANCSNACVKEEHKRLHTAQLKQVRDALRNRSTTANGRKYLLLEEAKIKKIVDSIPDSHEVTHER